MPEHLFSCVIYAIIPQDPSASLFLNFNMVHATRRRKSSVDYKEMDNLSSSQRCLITGNKSRRNELSNSNMRSNFERF